MSDRAVEERLRVALEDVAARLPVSDRPAPALDLRPVVESSRRVWLLAVAAAVVFVVAASVLAFRPGDERSLRSGPAGSAPDAVDSALPLLVFRERGSVWALYQDGRRELMVEGSEGNPVSYPAPSPDGWTVALEIPKADQPFNSPAVLDLRTGKATEVPSGGWRFSPDGHRIAGVVPRDDDVPEQIAISDTQGYEESGRLEIPLEAGAVRDLVWVDDSTLVVVASEAIYRAELARSDAESAAVTRLNFKGDPSELSITEPLAAGQAPAALRSQGGRVDLGELIMSGDEIRFRYVGPVPERAGSTVLDPSQVRLDRARTHLSTAPDGRVERSAGDTPAFIVSDGRNAFHLADGHLRLLLDGADFAAAP